jgi:hypothetical protein
MPKFYGEIPSMFHLKQLLVLLTAAEIMLENVVLRHQLSVLSHQKKRPWLHSFNRIFWGWLSRIWSGWRRSGVFITATHVKPPDSHKSRLVAQSSIRLYRGTAFPN